MNFKLVVLLVMFFPGVAYAQISGYEGSATDSLRGALPETSPPAESDASQPGLRGLEGNGDKRQPAPFEGADLKTNKANKIKKHDHHHNGKNKHADAAAAPVASGSEGNTNQPAPFEGADLKTNKANKVKKHDHHHNSKNKQAASTITPVASGSGKQKKSGFGLTDPAKTGIGLTDRTAKTGVGAAKTGAGASGKAVKEIFKAIF
jgi:hypothetical protein